MDDLLAQVEAEAAQPPVRAWTGKERIQYQVRELAELIAIALEEK
jgi:hypothetical protein